MNYNSNSIMLYCGLSLRNFVYGYLETWGEHNEENGSEIDEVI